MNPIHYKIRLEPDLDKFTFHGITEIEIMTEESVDRVTLNAVDLSFNSCTVKIGEEELECTFSLDPKKEEATINLPREVEGSMELTIDYSGNINPSLEGLYRSKYEVEGQTKFLAVTQFEERSARKAFPCFDHPQKKATFDIEFVIDENLKGIANTAVAEERNLDNGKKLLRFERTPKMSTYLLFFGVGDFEFIEDSSTRPLVRVATTPGKTKYGDFGLQMGRKALAFGEDYTGIEFPISKCDYIAVPDFAFGAMENWGAITFRENVLLVYPGVSSKADMEAVASVVSHETAHFWFGDLVSPAEWKYVWLNESFATFLSFAVLDKYYPEWLEWNTFVAGNVMRALRRDALVETMPLELPGDVEIRIGVSNADIIYRKGASILRMLAGYLGEEKLKQGLRHYLDKHKFGNATSREFWAAIEEATGEPIGEFAESWVYQPGYPIVEANVKGNELLLSQQIYTAIHKEIDRSWLIPIKILLVLKGGKTETISTLLKEKTTSITIPDGVTAFKVNTQQTGFYRVKYDKETLNRLGQLVKQKRLSEVDSFGLENDFYALVQRGDYPLTDYLNFLEKYFENEDRFLPLKDIAQNLREAYLVVKSQRGRISQVGRKIFENALKKIGLEPKERDGLQVSQMRDDLIWTAFMLNSKVTAKSGSTKFKDLMNGKKIHPDILASTLRIGAATDEKAMEYLKTRIAAADTPETERLYSLQALGYTKDKEALHAALEFDLESVPPKNRDRIISTAAQNPDMTDYMWEWFTKNIEKIDQLHPQQFENIMAVLIPICGLGKEQEAKEFLEEYMTKNQEVKDTIKMSLERLEINSRLSNA
jgi:tricorn protease interacting factor F2/3